MKWLLVVGGALIGIVALVALIGTLLPKGHVVTRTARFRKSPEAIWETMTGPPNWRPEVKSFELLPPQDGHRMWKEVDSHNQAILYQSVEETPPRRLVTRIADASLPYGGTWTHEITSEGGVSVLKITEDGEVYNPMFRFMSRFVFGHAASIEAYLKALQVKLGD